MSLWLLSRYFAPCLRADALGCGARGLASLGIGDGAEVLFVSSKSWLQESLAFGEDIFSAMMTGLNRAVPMREGEYAA